jgi:hypothetical protein
VATVQAGRAHAIAGVARKLGAKAGHVLVLVSAPPGWAPADLPGDVRLQRRRARADALAGLAEGDVAVAFFPSQAELRHLGPGLGLGLPAGASLWVAWPRRAGGHVSDITDNLVRAVFLPLGLVDVKVAGLGEDWSALRFVWRRPPRAGPAGAGKA